MLTCGRCGRGLAVAYTGAPPGRPVYRCDRPNLALGLSRCLGFGGPRVDAAFAAEALRVVEPMAIEAAREAERMIAGRESVGEGKSGAVRVDPGGCRIIKKKKK